MSKKNTGNLLPDEDVLDILLKAGLISEDQRQEILVKKARIKNRLEQVRTMGSASPGSKSKIVNPVTIVDIVASLGFQRVDAPGKTLDEEAVYQALARAWKMPYKKIDPLKLDLNLVTSTIPLTFAMKHLVLPVRIKDGSLIVATSNPADPEVMADIAQVSKMKVQPVLSTKTDIIKLISEFFGFKRSIMAAESQYAGPTIDLGNLEQFVRLKSSEELLSDDQHVVNAVDHLFSYAFDQRASDIHIEPKRDKSIVRLRIDGTLHTVYTLPKAVHPAITSRIKTIARLDMAEKRRPQDGRIKMERAGVESEIRVSSIPVAFGEKMVMRIMDPEILFQDLEDLGFTSMDLLRYQQFISMPHGVILVTGPTGSGKSTTLYSSLRRLSTPDINITTVEDPIEMIYEDFNQIAVQPAVGITFASILRNILRQDPDIIMIGEMRDLETAENAVQAALTGHLVLSTLHTNDAPSSITRLLDLGVPSFLIKATLVGIVAQRLVKKICPECKESFEMDSSELEALGLDIGKKGPVTLQRGKGCLKCRGTGYYGRSGIYEVLPITESIQALINQEADTRKIRDTAVQEGMVTLRENAIKKLLDGTTTYQEVLRVTWEQL
ncbi:MAG: type II/IV secretion system protein [Deltaproteobacteria bacterium]|nr:type II/IV secretion system protein [Deltaproteobacteria bacterium]